MSDVETQHVQKLWLWWGGDATDRERTIWREFQAGMERNFGDDMFLESMTEDRWGEICDQLEIEGWTVVYEGEGAWWRIVGWSRTLYE